MSDLRPHARELGTSVEAAENELARAAQMNRPSYEQYGIVSVDPGEAHVGMAVGVGLGFTSEHDELAMSFETTPAIALRALHTAITCGWIDVLVIEDFRLQPDKAMAQTGSDMPTSQMIGALKWMLIHNAIQTDRMNLPKLIMQPPSLKKTTASVLKHYGIRAATRGSDHARDAELHWWYLLLSERGLMPGINPRGLPRLNDYGSFNG